MNEWNENKNSQIKAKTKDNKDNNNKRGITFNRIKFCQIIKISS